MNFKYKPDDNEIKLIILYALYNLKKSPSYQTLTQVITPTADVNYFEIHTYINNLVELGSLSEHTVDNETVFALTESGEEMCEYFSSRIPASIRQKIESASSDINNDRSAENKVYADYVPISEKEYKVVCGILENNIHMLDFELYAGSKERAKKICEYFKEHTQDFYINIVRLIEDSLDNDK